MLTTLVMNTLLTIMLPVFGIVLIGFAAAKFRVLDEAAIRGVTKFVFVIALPVALFRSMATAPLPEEIPWGLFGSYYIAALSSFFLGMFLTGRFFGRSLVGQAVTGLAAAFPNTVLLGIPVIVTAFGERAMVPIFLLLSVHATILLTTATVVLEAGRSSEAGGSPREIVLHTVQGIVTNPVVMAILGGLMWNLMGLPFPAVLDGITEKLGQAALPTAVFAVGASTAMYKIDGNTVEAGVLILLKLILHPALVYVLAAFVFRLDPLWTATATLLAAMPSGVNVYLFADRYDTGHRTAATSILASTPLSFLTIWLYVTLLVPTVPPA